MRNREETYKVAFYSTIGLLALDAYFSFIMGQRVSGEYYLGFLAVPILLWAMVYFKGKMAEAKALAFIKMNWGKSIKRKRNFKRAANLFNKLQEKEKFQIDDQTWNDLTMNDIFQIIDRTLCDAGEQVLYNIMRSPSFNRDELKKRSEIIDFLKDNQEFREKLQYKLYKFGRDKKSSLPALLWGEISLDNSSAILYYILFGAALLAPFSIAFLGLGGVFIIGIVFIINMILHLSAKNKIAQGLHSVGRLGSMVRTALSMKDIEEPKLEDKLSELKKAAVKCSGIARKTRSIGRTEGIDLLSDYFNIYFLMEEVSLFSVIEELHKFRKELQRIYILLGEIDAYISIASYRKELGEYTEPEFTEENNGVHIINGKHPLVENAVANSLEIEKGGIILTGSNMSGKSTFLRTIGVNALFAQTINTCLVEKYSAPLLKVMTSISPSDDIVGGKSYYLGEAEALLRIIRGCEDNVPSLCIIDEIFRGTNPIERISAAAEILDYLPDHNAITIVATHDIELTGMVKNHYECYYFTEDVDENGLKFDYKLKKGISKTRNAIKVLKFIGYPEEIINNSNRRIESEL